MHGGLENAPAALRTLADRLLPAEVRLSLRAVTFRLVLAKVELRFQLRVELNDRREWPPSLAAEPLQRPYLALGDQLLGLGNLELPPRHDLPETERALLALELLVILVY